MNKIKKAGVFATWLLICLMISGCSAKEEPQPTEQMEEPEVVMEEEVVESEPETIVEEEEEIVIEDILEEEPVKAVQVEFNHVYEMQESATIIGYDENGNALWTYETDAYEATQLDRVSEIGMHHGVYYFVEDGSIVTLNLADGSVIWKNDEFQGACPYFDFGEKGILYISGYFGPDLFVVDREGATVKKIECFSTDYCWPYEVDEQDGMVRIKMGMGPEGDGQYTLVVNLSDDSYDVE